MSDKTTLKIGDLTVHIDRSLCIGSGNCVKVGPDLFDLDDESIAVFAPGALAAARAKVLDACEVCPVQALIVVDSEGRELVP